MIGIKRCVQGVAFLMANTLATAGVISLDGVDFTSSWSGNTLRIEIDAAGRTGGWADASFIDAIAINSPDAWSWASVSDIQLSGPLTTTEGFTGGIQGTGLNANGCQDVKKAGGNHQCWTGLAALTDNMYFDFTFIDGIVTEFTDTPHLKVRFINEQGDKVGSLLSEDLLGGVTTEVPEPASIALLGLGLLGLGLARRKAK